MLDRIIPMRPRRAVTFDSLTPRAQELLIQLTIGSRVVPKLVWAPLELLHARFAISAPLRRGFLLTITDLGRAAIQAETQKVEAP